MSLRDRLAGFRVPPLELRGPTSTLRALAWLEKRVNQTGAPSGSEELQQLRRRVRRWWNAHRGFSGISRRLFTRIPWVLFVPSSRPDSWLCRDEEFSRAFLQECRRLRSTLVTRRLLSTLLQDWPTECPSLSQWCTETAGLLKSVRSPLLSAWRTRHRRWKLISPEGPRKVAQFLLSVGKEARSALEETGLTGILSTSRYLRAVLREAAALVADVVPSAGTIPAVEHLETFLGQEGSAGGRRQLLFPEDGPRYVSSLLAPCTGSGTHCPAPVRESLKGFALRTLGDPRLSSGRWEIVDDAVRDLVLRWLTQETIDLFLELISLYAPPHQWQRRRDLWKGYLDSGHITEAWAVLGSSAARGLRRRTTRQLPAHGRLIGALSNQSVLLMRLAGWTIVEWSHAGACRFYPPGWPSVPRLYDARYHATELRAPCLRRIIHYQGDAWIGEIDRFIRNEILP